jgi:hypothetical protein
MIAEDRDRLTNADLPSGNQQPSGESKETGGGLFGSIALDMIDEDTNVSLTAYHHDDDETDDVMISVSIAAADITIGCSSDRAQQFCEEITQAVENASEQGRGTKPSGENPHPQEGEDIHP